jgi:hypothetical protein
MMNKHLLRVVLMAGGLLILILGGLWLATTRADAAFANVGIPVRCYNIGFSSPITLTCVTPPGSGVSFVGSQSVPNGYYFLVTDVMFTPEGGAGDAVIDFDLQDAYGASSIQSINHFRNLGGVTFGQHFNAPMWVLLATHYLKVVANAANQQNLEIRVNGFLVTNLQYVPVVISP